ncbi:hypothetical protein ACGFIE_25460 [Micromonospora sp. NPDC049275]|uniref:hypothetical protein n=1 Tax=Micromonospora sp. NPDC049275 TaxID=3364268 RepID=UPI00371E532F
MPQYRITLADPVPHIHEAELRSRVFFVSELIEEFTLLGDGDVVDGIDVRTREPADPADLERKLHQMIKNDVLALYPNPARETWRSPSERSVLTGVYENMVERGIAYELGEGQIAVGEEFCQVMGFFDRSVRAMVAEEFGAREYRYPTLIPLDTLRRCGYLASFPQHLMFVTRLHSDMDTYQEFLEDVSAGRLDRRALYERCGNLDYALPPTMCYHTFSQFAEKPTANRVITSRGKSFRFESRYRQSLERLWDFTIRETVFLGTQDFVVDARSRFIGRIFELLEGLDLAGHCEVANDPFFGRQDTGARITSQRLLELKYELRLPVAADRTIAVGSFNLHGQIFSKAFGISHADGAQAYTGCTGIGLERLTYAFLCQYGLDSAQWPDAVRRAESISAVGIG